MDLDLPDVMKLHDVFICHAREDKDEFVRPLVEALRSHHIEVWYAEFALDVGDSLREAIDRGLATSRYGIVVLSPSFFRKRWPNRELNGLVAREMGEDHGIILPIWHGVDQMGEVAAETVEFLDHEHVALPQGAQAAAESGAVVATAPEANQGCSRLAQSPALGGRQSDMDRSRKSADHSPGTACTILFRPAKARHVCACGYRSIVSTQIIHSKSNPTVMGPRVAMNFRGFG